MHRDLQSVFIVTARFRHKAATRSFEFPALRRSFTAESATFLS